jgi:hypothetical protein
MRRFTTAIAVMALAVAACSSGSAALTAAPSPIPSTAAATVAPTVPATTEPTAKPLPTATPVPLSATVEFSGKACAWKGVRDIPRGTALTINMVNTPAATKATGGAAFVFMRVADDLTWDQVQAASANHDANYIPKWVDQSELIMQTPDNIAAGDSSMTHQLLSDRYLLMCFTKTGPTTTDGYPAALLYVYDR